MSDDRLFERNAQAWLETGPSTAPRRVVDAALLAIETTSQQRDLRAPWRLPKLTLNTRFAVAAAVGLLVVGAGVLILRNPHSQIGQPSPSPSPTASPGSSPISLAELYGSWASVGTRHDPMLNGGNPPVIETMAIDAAGLRIDSYKGDVISPASIAGADGQLTLRMNAPQELLTRLRWDCTTGDSGRYYASLSPDEQTLTLTLAMDNCASRDAILTGDWTRWSCPNAAQYAYCDHVSELTPGRYVSPMFRPFGDGTSGHLAYTVPAGWAKLAQPPTWPELGTASEVWLTRLDTPDRQAIRVFSNVYATYPVALPDEPTQQCRSGIGSNGTATQVADFLQSLIYVSASGRMPVTIGGLTGVQLDVALLPGFFDPCNAQASNGGPTVLSKEIPFFQDDSGQGGGIFLNSDRDAYARFILLDTPTGRNVIVVSARNAASLEARVAEAMPVIESFEFLP